MVVQGAVYLSRAWRKLLRKKTEEEQVAIVTEQLRRALDLACNATPPVILRLEWSHAFYTPLFGGPAWEWWDHATFSIDSQGDLDSTAIAALLPEGTHVEIWR
jgi:hypothetical protein